MKIAFVLGTGVDDIDFMNVNSLLDKCKSYMPIEIHHLGGSSAAYTKSGFEIRTLTVGTGHTDYNAIVVPGASSYEALVGKPEVKGFFVGNIENGSHVYSICSGTKLLCELNLIEDFTISVHQQKELEYAKYKVKLSHEIVRDRWLTTVSADAAFSYLKSIECFYQILHDNFPRLYETIVRRVELASTRLSP